MPVYPHSVSPRPEAASTGRLHWRAAVVLSCFTYAIIRRAVTGYEPEGLLAPPDERVPVSGSRLWRVYLLLALTLSALLLAFPVHGLALWTTVGLSAVAATVVGVVRHRPRRRAAWLLLASAQLTSIASSTAAYAATRVLDQDNPLASIADLCRLLTYPLAGAGIALFLSGHASMRDRASLIDAVTVTAGLGLPSWVYLIAPGAPAPTGFGRFVAVAYPLGGVLLLTMLARLVGDGGLRFRAVQLLVLGAAGLAGATIAHGLTQVGGQTQVGGGVQGGWVVFCVAWGCAALHPTMVRLGEDSPRADLRTGRLRVVALLTAMSLIAPAVLVAATATSAPVEVGTVALFSAALFLLVVARLWGMLNANQQSAERERILRSASEALVAAQGLAAIHQVALDGVISLTRSTGIIHAAIYADRTDGLTCVASFGEPIDADRLGDLWQAAADGGSLNVAGTVSVTPLRYGRADRGMLIVDSAAPLTLDQHGALYTLAAQVALAVESANLAADLRRRQSDERFRGILQSTSDIIVIVNARGEITYGTPSLGRNLGRSAEEVTGRPLAEFLRVDDSLGAIAMFAAFAAGTSHAQAIADWHVRHRDGRFVAFEVLSNNLLEDLSVGGILLTMRDVSERRALEAQLKHQAFHDGLTGLANRALFQDRAEHALARTARQGTLVAMLMLDIDDFKNVNDTRGHAAGDELLVQIAARLRSVLRRGATVSRFGGDEFAVLVEDLADVVQAENFAERALHTFATPFTVDGEGMVVSASIGLVVTGGPQGSLDITELIRCADLALYAAKDQGKGVVNLYHRDLSTRMIDRLTQRSDLERAMGADEFVLHYQPIAAIDTGQIVGCEALVRWRHPGRGLLPPMDFVELAEETGLIVDLGRWVLDRACAQLRAWADAGHPGLRLSVNVSARQLHEKGFVEDVHSALRRHRCPATLLVLELTESVFALNDQAISDQLRALRTLGVKIAMDDFGTGYSSLSYLQKFQLDVLKVDKSFVDGLGDGNPDGSALVNAIIALAHSLRLEVVAEGIEHAAQRDELRAMGCGLGQGYLYSRPVEPHHLAALLSHSSQRGRRQRAAARTTESSVNRSRE